MGQYTTEQMREYQNHRRETLRIKLTLLLGGRCARCTATENLQFDHIDRATKLFSIASGLDKPWGTLLAEVAKCQLLCIPHHLEKTREDGVHPNRARGERAGSAKLTDDDVRVIRMSSLSDRELSSSYGVSRTQIYNVKIRRSWKHVV